MLQAEVLTLEATELQDEIKRLTKTKEPDTVTNEMKEN